MDSPQRFCVRWNSYKTNLQTAFPKLLTSEHFVDVTLACEKQYLKCHKIVLSACSVYFEDLLVNNPCQHPIIFMKDVAFWEMKALVEFMYKGEVNVSQEQLDSLLKSAESLQIRGLSGAKPWAGEMEDVAPKKDGVEEAKSLQITSCRDKDDGCLEDDSKSTSVKAEGDLDLKDDFDESTDDISYMGNTDDDTGTEYAPDEPYSEQTREPGPSAIAEIADHGNTCNYFVVGWTLEFLGFQSKSQPLLSLYTLCDGLYPEFISFEDLDLNQLKSNVAPVADRVRVNKSTSTSQIQLTNRVKCEGRVFMRNPRRSCYKQYTMASMWAALEKIEQGLSVYRASIEFGVPRKTLRNWMKKYNIMSYFDLRKQHRIKKGDIQ